MVEKVFRLTFANSRYTVPLAAGRTEQCALSFDHLMSWFAFELHQRIDCKSVTN